MSRGTYHVLALSGAQVALVAGLVVALARRLGATPALQAVLGGGVAAFYAVFVGGDVPVVRASLMAAVLLGGRALDLDADLANLLGLAALVLLVHRPSSITDVGFQLSFGATLGLLLLTPALSTGLPRLPLGIERALAASLAAQAALLPLLALHFHRIAPAGLVLNLVAVPLSSAVLLAGLLVLACARARERLGAARGTDRLARRPRPPAVERARPRLSGPRPADARAFRARLVRPPRGPRLARARSSAARPRPPRDRGRARARGPGSERGGRPAARDGPGRGTGGRDRRALAGRARADGGRGRRPPRDGSTSARPWSRRFSGARSAADRHDRGQPRPSGPRRAACRSCCGHSRWARRGRGRRPRRIGATAGSTRRCGRRSRASIGGAGRRGRLGRRAGAGDGTAASDGPAARSAQRRFRRARSRVRRGAAAADRRHREGAEEAPGPRSGARRQGPAPRQPFEQRRSAS